LAVNATFASPPSTGFGMVGTFALTFLRYAVPVMLGGTFGCGMPDTWTFAVASRRSARTAPCGQQIIDGLERRLRIEA
jgi:hypothetical protein